jgi:hypothetical protein
MTVAPPISSPCPTPVPTPLAAGVNRVHTGTSFATMVSMLMGLVCAGYVACLGYLLIRK